ncbi:AraC family transcriptional regulator [Vibrio gangliei]|uniref:AraC family transcriptional regulator n=1 Tax=Vibrio gangliei TaxID=2077090 RepID=UPI000D019E71|nr:AraC family transcriptional regulator [Vibrio gangliei]
MKPQFYRSSVVPVELRCSTGTKACYGKHTHDEFSIGSVDGGHSVYFNTNTETQIGVGSLVIVNPLDVHSCNPALDTDWSYKMLYVCPKWLGYIQTMTVDNPSKNFIPFSQIHTDDPELYRQFQSLASSIIANTENMRIEEECIMFFSRLFHETNTGALNKPIPRINIVKAYNYICDNFKKCISVKDIARNSGLSEYHLIHAFRKSYGITPHAMQVSMRINEAKALLKKGQDIAAVASELGFNDQSHFHRNFKRLVAATPAEYRK